MTIENFPKTPPEWDSCPGDHADSDLAQLAAQNPFPIGISRLANRRRGTGRIALDEWPLWAPRLPA